MSYVKEIKEVFELLLNDKEAKSTATDGTVFQAKYADFKSVNNGFFKKDILISFSRGKGKTLVEGQIPYDGVHNIEGFATYFSDQIKNK